MRTSYSFPEDVVASLTRERYEYPDPRVQERMEILWLKSQEETHERIAKLANVSRSTVQRTLRIYAAKGLDGVRTFGWKGRASALTPHQETIEAEFRERPPHTVHEAVRRIEAMTGVSRKATRVRKFMKETLKMKCLKVAPVPVPPKKSVEEHAQTQTDFLKSGSSAAVG
jgi:transposase